MKRTFVALVLAGSACSRPAATSAPPVAAEGSGVKILRSEVDTKAAGRLLALAVQENETRRATLNDLLFDALLKKEAEAQHKTPDEVLKAEAAADRTPPDPAQVDGIYQANRARLGNRTEANVKAEIVEAILRQRAEEARAAFGKRLIKKWNVHIHLPAPRIDVKVPSDAPILGPAAAPVTLVEFADFQCPFCQKAEAQVESILEKNPKSVRFVQLDFPLEFHSRALPAAEAARCAQDQGKFFEYRHSLLVIPGGFEDEDLVHRAESLHLNVPTFKQCLDSKRHEEAVRKVFEEGRDLGVSATPTFFVNGQILEGFSGEALQELIDSELNGE